MNELKATHEAHMTNGRIYMVCVNEYGMWEDVFGCAMIDTRFIKSLNPLPTPSAPETFDWKEAMRLFADGVELDRRSGETGGWMELAIFDNGSVVFNPSNQYRRKPAAPPAPKVSERWVNVYRYAETGINFPTLEAAKGFYECVQEKPIARLKITVTEGESLPKVEVLPV